MPLGAVVSGVVTSGVVLPVVLVSVAGLLKGAPAALLAPRVAGTVTGAAAAVVWAAAGMAVTSGRTLIGEGAPDIGSARSETWEISSSGTARTAMDLVCEYVPSGAVTEAPPRIRKPATWACRPTTRMTAELRAATIATTRSQVATAPAGRRSTTFMTLPSIRVGQRTVCLWPTSC